MTRSRKIYFAIFDFDLNGEKVTMICEKFPESQITNRLNQYKDSITFDVEEIKNKKATIAKGQQAKLFIVNGIIHIRYRDGSSKIYKKHNSLNCF